MQKMLHKVLAGFVAAAAFLASSNALAGEPSMDPTVVAPDEFETALENEFVRVVRVTVKDGTEPAKHSHPHRVVVFLNDCTWLDTADDGSMIEETYRAGEVSWQVAMIHGGAPNHVKDTCKLLEIELK